MRVSLDFVILVSTLILLGQLICIPDTKNKLLFVLMRIPIIGFIFIVYNIFMEKIIEGIEEYKKL